MEADRCLASVGFNEPAAVRQISAWRELLRRFANPMVAILLLASVISGFVRDFVNSFVVLGIVLLSVAVEFVQTRRSRQAADALTGQVGQLAMVCRDGRFTSIPQRMVVPGDVVRLDAGDLVPADGVILEGRDLHLSEAALTGESLPVEKFRDDAVLMGTSVVSGGGIARITKTGGETEFSGIAKSLAQKAPQSEFERGIARFGSFILKTVMFLVLFVFLVSAVSHRDPLESLLFAVALAVGLTPEFLPMITTVTLTRGAVRMAKANVIVKNLAAIQNFGSMDILCCDKTGTLTTGEMSLQEWIGPLGLATERPLLLCYLNSFFESGIDNPVDDAVLRKSKLNALDSAVLRHEHPDISGFVKVDEIPFDFERRRVSIVAQRCGETVLVSKGAPEQVLDVCSAYESPGGLAPLDDHARATANATFESLSRRGLRVLAVAYRNVEPRPAFDKSEEHDLILAGFVAFADPPRADARQTLAKLSAAGVQVKVLTGDNALVAAQICEQVGIPTTGLLLGSLIDGMTDAALFHEAERVHVFARVSPAQKNRILRVLKLRGHVVGFLGDGINDAPSLHAADVGISVSGATDVARDAADIIMLEPSLSALLTGIIEGRRAFGNVMKYLLMGTSSNFGNMVSMAGAAVVLPFLPMLPSQILLNNFLYDIAQLGIPSDDVDPDFVRKPRRWDIGSIKKFMFWVGPISSLYDFMTFFVLLRVLHASERAFHTGWFVESLLTQTLVIFVIRTGRSPLKSRPSPALTRTALGVAALAIALPLSPFAARLGFVPLPALYYLFLVTATVTYLAIVELVKRFALRSALD